MAKKKLKKLVKKPVQKQQPKRVLKRKQTPNRNLKKQTPKITKTKSKARKRSVVIVKKGKHKDKRDIPEFKKEDKRILAKVKSRVNVKAKAEDLEKERKRRERAKKKVKRDVKISKEKSDKKKSKEASVKKKKWKRVSPYKSIIDLAKKRKLTPKQKSTLRKHRKNLTNRKYRWRKKLAKAKTKAERTRINKEILEISIAIRAINVRLGTAKKLKKVPEKKFEKKKIGKKIVQKSVIPVWEGRDKLADLLKGGFYKTFVIQGERYRKGQVADIYIAFSSLEDFAYSFGVTTPHIVVLERVTDKIAEFDVYDYAEPEE